MPNSAARKLKKKDDTPSVWTKRIRAAAVGVLVGVGCLGLAAFVVVHWAERQIFTTDNWVALVSPLPRQPVVSDALGSTISDKVFEAAPVEQEISDALPPRAAFLAKPLASQLKTITTNSARKLVAGDAFQSIWSGANRLAMNRLVSTARNKESPVQAKINQKFDIDISDASGGLRKALGAASNALPALQPAANKAIDISTDLKARPHRLHQVVRSTDTLSVILPLLVVACFLSALAFSNHRRHTALAFAITTIVFMLAELIAIKWLRQETISQVNNLANIPAVTYIYDSLVGWLRHMIYWVLAAMVIAIGGILLGGPADWAVSARKFMRLHNIGNSRAMLKWRQARLWVRQWRGYLWLGASVLVLVSLVTIVPVVNGRSILNALLLVISLCAAVQITASPRKTIK
jgi:hypothetical protein